VCQRSLDTRRFPSRDDELPSLLDVSDLHPLLPIFVLQKTTVAIGYGTHGVDASALPALERRPSFGVGVILIALQPNRASKGWIALCCLSDGQFECLLEFEGNPGVAIYSMIIHNQLLAAFLMMPRKTCIA
jgi:hypothetical protein